MEKTVSYQDRIQKKAEEFAKIMFGNMSEQERQELDLPDTWEQLTEQQIVDVTYNLHDFAEKAVRDEGEAVRLGNEIGMSADCHTIDYHLQQLGYLKTEEHG